MLQKIILKFKCLKTGSIKGYGGSEFYDLISKLLDGIDGSLNTKRQEKFCNNKGSLVLSYLSGKLQRKSSESLLYCGGNYTIVLSCLNRSGYERIPYLLKWLGENEVYFGSAVLSFESSRKLFPDNYSYTEYASEIKTASKSIQFSFLSPVYYPMERTSELFPKPTTIFQDLIEKWNYYSGMNLPPLDWNMLQVTKYDLRTRRTCLGEQVICGFLGNCTFVFNKDTPDEYRWIISLLAGFSSVCSVGSYTNMGLGQTKVTLL